MGFLGFGKKKEKKAVMPPAEKLIREQGRKRHQVRIDRLVEQLEKTKNQLDKIEVNTDLTKTEREDTSNRLIKRMVLTQYEIDIREDVLSWL